MFLTSICILLNCIHCMTSFAILVIIKYFPWVASNRKVFWTSIKNFLCYFKTSIKNSSNLDSLEKVLKSINRKQTSLKKKTNPSLLVQPLQQFWCAITKVNTFWCLQLLLYTKQEGFHAHSCWQWSYIMLLTWNTLTA